MTGEEALRAPGQPQTPAESGGEEGWAWGWGAGSRAGRGEGGGLRKVRVPGRAAVQGAPRRGVGEGGRGRA